MVMVRGGGDALAVVHRQCIEDSFPSAVGVTNGSHPQPGEAVFVTSAVGCPSQRRGHTARIASTHVGGIGGPVHHRRAWQRQ